MRLMRGTRVAAGLNEEEGPAGAGPPLSPEECEAAAKAATGDNGDDEIDSAFRRRFPGAGASDPDVDGSASRHRRTEPTDKSEDREAVGATPESRRRRRRRWWWRLAAAAFEDAGGDALDAPGVAALIV